MKYILLTTFLVVSLNFASHSQVKDSANILVTYNLKYIKDVERLDQVRKDELQLLIGNNYVNFFSYVNFRADSLRKANPAEYSSQVIDMNGEKTTIPARTKAPSSLNKEILFIDRNYDSLACLGKVFDIKYRYEEKVEKPIWKLESTTKEILGHTCQLATTFYGGRSWSVWYSPEITISEGPWLLRGLPGLILKAEDSENHYSFECTSIERLKDKKRIIAIDTDNQYRKLSKAEAYEMEKIFFEDMNSALSRYSSLEVKITSLSGERKRTYNPIELLK